MGWRNPLELTEFEVHSEAYFNLKNTFKNVRGEFHFKKDGVQAARFDIVILNDSNELEFIVEVKKSASSKSKTQLYKYEYLTGKPVMYIKGMEAALKASELVSNALDSLGKTELKKELTK